MTTETTMQTGGVSPQVPPDIEDAYVRIAVMSVGQLMVLRFRRNKLAVSALVLLILMYFVSLMAGFFAPYYVNTVHDKFPGIGPNSLHIMDKDNKLHWPPFVYGYQVKMDLETYRRVASRTDDIYPVKFFGRGDTYTLLGLIETDRHFFVVDNPGKIFILGTDSLGRDLFSRIIYGSQVSLTIGLVGVAISLLLGSFIGTMAGYYGGTFDNIVMRITEVLRSFPTIPLWLALASALPPNLDSIKVYLGITVVLSFIGWTGLARQLRAKVLALRESDFVMAARVINCRDIRIIARHLLPNTLSHIIVSATLSIPATILGETALSFLGLGIRPPMTSWGLLLSEAQATRVLLQQPWLLWPIAPVMIVALTYNLLGDGIRDAADPFSV